MKVAMSKRFIGAFAKEAAALGFVKELKEWKNAGILVRFLPLVKTFEQRSLSGMISII